MWVKNFVIYLDAICNIFTLIPSGPVAFPTDIDDISFLTYSSVISGNVHFPSSELIRVKWILSSTKPRGVALLSKRSPTVDKCSLNISAMSARSSTTTPSYYNSPSLCPSVCPSFCPQIIIRNSISKKTVRTIRFKLDHYVDPKPAMCSIL